jgi:ABC-2 type transport system ATP-binding protein
MKRIKELKAEGRTMVFVSHNPKQVVNLCNRGLVLRSGEMLYEGSAKGAVEALGYELDDDNDEDTTD